MSKDLLTDFWFTYKLPVPVKTSIVGLGKNQYIDEVGIEEFTVEDLLNSGLYELINKDYLLGVKRNDILEILTSLNTDAITDSYSKNITKILEALINDKSEIDMAKNTQEIIDSLVKFTLNGSQEQSAKLFCVHTKRPIPPTIIYQSNIQNIALFTTLKKKLSESLQLTD